MPTLRELRETYSFADLMDFHATLDALEDADAEARAKAKAEAAKGRR